MLHTPKPQQLTRHLLTIRARRLGERLRSGHLLIRRLRWHEGALLYALHRKPYGFNPGEKWESKTNEVKFMYQYDQPECETWAQWCDQADHPDTASAHKWMLCHAVYRVKFKFPGRLLYPVSIDRLYAVAVYLREQNDRVLAEQLVYEALVLSKDQWDVFRRPYVGQPKQEQRQPQAAITLYDTAHDLALIGIGSQYGNNQTMRVEITPANRKQAVTLAAALELCETVLEKFKAGEVVSSEELQLAINTTKLVRSQLWQNEQS